MLTVDTTNAFKKRLNQSRLPNTWFTAYKDNLALAGPSDFKPRL